MGITQSASIIINNYNYGRFLPQAIESALNQTYSNTEVIVVDDGSTDGSREVISRYGDLVIPVSKENGGQGSACYAGFKVSNGEVVFFLDADDVLLPGAVEQAISLFSEDRACTEGRGVVKVHWPMWEIDEHGTKTGAIVPRHSLSNGDLFEIVVEGGPDSDGSSPTSGNAWSRSFLEQVLPMPEFEDKHGIDAYLLTFAPVLGRIQTISEPQGCHRQHSDNSAIHELEVKARRYMARYDGRCDMLNKCLRDMDIYVDTHIWKQKNACYLWMERIGKAIHEIKLMVPIGDTIILVDGDEWGVGHKLSGRNILPFLERDGQYWGPPNDDLTAIRELDRLRRGGASFLIFAWPTFWCRDFYSDFHRHLRSTFTCVREDEDILVFDLREA